MIKFLMDNLIKFFNKIFFVFGFIIDKSLTFIVKKLKTDKNTFVGFILTLICIYFTLSYFIDWILAISFGITMNLNSKLFSALLIALPIITFKIIIESKFATHSTIKVSYFVFFYSISAFFSIMAIIKALSFVTWIAIFSVPSYQRIIIEDEDLIRRAIFTINIIVPLIYTFQFYIWIRYFILENMELKMSIMESTGWKLDEKSTKTGPYSLEQYFGKDNFYGNKAILSELGRYFHLLVIGNPYMNPEKFVFEPMIARDLEKKKFFKEAQKQLADTLLKTKKATLTAPFTNEYMNKHFSLSMIKPSTGNELIFNSYLSKIYNGNNPKDLGITYISSNVENLKSCINIASNLNLDYKCINIDSTNDFGLNPLSINDSYTAGVLVASLFTLLSNKVSQFTDPISMSITTLTMIQNLATLLAEVYPKLHDGEIPTLFNLQQMFTDFLEIRDLLVFAQSSTVLSNKLKNEIEYINNVILGSEEHRENTKAILVHAISEMNLILSNKKLANILCNTTNNLDFAKELKDGSIVFVNSSTQDTNSILNINNQLIGDIVLQYLWASSDTRLANNPSNTPHFVYIQDAPTYSNMHDKDFRSKLIAFSNRKIGVTISATTLESLTQFIPLNILINTISSKLILGDGSKEENKIWADHFGVTQKWVKLTQNFDDSDPDKITKGSKTGTQDFVPILAAGKMIGIKQGGAAYKLKQEKGSYIAGICKLNPIDEKVLKKYSEKSYKFECDELEDEIKVSQIPIKFKQSIANPKKSHDSSGPIKYR